MAVPSSLTENYGALLTTTLKAMEGTLRDNITRGNKFLAWLESRGRFRTQDGGERVKVALMHELNSTSDIYAGYGLLDTTPQDGITSAFYDWAQYSVSITINRKEERQNSGRSQALNLLEAKTTQAMNSLRESLNNSIVSGRITSGASAADGEFTARVGSLDSGASGVLPLPALIDVTPARSRTDIGNINPSTYSFWANKNANSSATTFAGYKQELNNLYNTCSQGAGGVPDLLLSDQVAWEQYWNSLQNQERYFVSDQRTIDVLGGTDALAFRRAGWIWDEVVPDVETNANVVDSVGTVTASTVYMINSESFEFVRDAQTDFITTPFVRPENQDARVAQILWMGALGVNNRRKNGVLDGITRTAITS